MDATHRARCNRPRDRPQVKSEMFTTRVKATGQLFDATTDLGPDESLYRDASRPLKKDTKYAGHLFDAFPKTGAEGIKFSKAEWHVFLGDELEDFPVTALRLVRVRRS